MLDSSPSSFLRCILVAAAWYLTNGIHGIVMQEYSYQQTGTHPLTFFLWITALQLLVGSLVGFAITRTFFTCKTDEKCPSASPKIGRSYALFYAAGCFLTNSGFLHGSASTVQSVKLIEPFQIFLLAKILMRQPNERYTFNRGTFGTTVVTIGAVVLLIYERKSQQVSIVLTILSGFFLSTCHVLQLKERAEKETGDSSPSASASAYTLIRYLTHLSWHAFWMLLVPSVTSLPCSVFNTKDIITATRGLLFFWYPLYQYLSLLVLSWTSYHAHTLLHAGSRMTAIVMAILWFQEPVSLHRMTGLVFAGLGALWYAAQARASVYRSEASAGMLRYRGMTVALAMTFIVVTHWALVIAPAMQHYQIDDVSGVLSIISWQRPILPITLPTDTSLALFPTTIHTDHHNIPLGKEVSKEMRKMTELALAENNVSCGDCGFLIPTKLIQNILLGKTRQKARSSYVLAKHRREMVSAEIGRDHRLSQYAAEYRTHNVIYLSRSDSPGDHFFQLVASFLMRTIPVLNTAWNAELVAFASSYGFVFYVTHENGDLRLCGSTPLNRKQKLNGDQTDCLSVTTAAFDSGLADWNFDTALRHFSIHQYAALQMQNKFTHIEARQLDGRQVLEVKVCADGKEVNGGDLFGPEVVRHILSSRGQSDVLVAIGKSAIRTPQIAVVGSILDETSNANLNWGTGVIKDKILTSKHLPSGIILAVRGPRSRELMLKYFGVNHMPIGDPALLAMDMLSQLQSKDRNITEETKKDVCFVIHEVDRPYMKQQCPWCMDLLVDNHIREPISILFELQKCRRVVSSSLHGIIFSHALAIPAVAIKLGDRVFGGDFKFRDHMHAVGVTSFQERLRISDRFKNGTVAKEEWIEMVDNAIQPKFPIPTNQFYETFPQVTAVL